LRYFKNGGTLEDEAPSPPAGRGGGFGFTRETSGALVAHAAPHLVGIDLLIRVQPPGALQENLRRFGIGGIGDAAIIHWTDRRTLGLVEVSDTLGATLVSDDIDVIADALAITDMVAFPLGVATGFKDGLVRALGEAGPARKTLFRNT